MSAQRSPSHLEGRPVYLWITSLLPTGPTGQAGDLWTTSLLPTDPQPYRDCDDRTARGAGRLVSSRSDLWEDGTWSRASMLRPRSLYPSVQLTLELVGCSINAGTLPVTYVSGPDISILPNHRTFLICLDIDHAAMVIDLKETRVCARGLTYCRPPPGRCSARRRAPVCSPFANRAPPSLPFAQHLPPPPPPLLPLRADARRRRRATALAAAQAAASSRLRAWEAMIGFGEVLAVRRTLRTRLPGRTPGRCSAGTARRGASLLVR